MTSMLMQPSTWIVLGHIYHLNPTTTLLIQQNLNRVGMPYTFLTFTGKWMRDNLSAITLSLVFMYETLSIMFPNYSTKIALLKAPWLVDSCYTPYGALPKPAYCLYRQEQPRSPTWIPTALWPPPPARARLRVCWNLSN